MKRRRSERRGIRESEQPLKHAVLVDVVREFERISPTWRSQSAPTPQEVWLSGNQFCPCGDTFCGAMQVEAQLPLNSKVPFTHTVGGRAFLAIEPQDFLGRERANSFKPYQPFLEETEFVRHAFRGGGEESFIVTLRAEDRDSHGIDAEAKHRACQRRQVWFPTNHTQCRSSASTRLQPTARAGN
jgi:hypothetical protein